MTARPRRAATAWSSPARAESPPSLTLRERSALFERAVASAGGRLPVIAATGTPNLADTLELTRAAERAGVDAVLVVAPAFVKPSQHGLARYFTTVARSTELPVHIYHIPGRAAVSVAAETVARVAGDCPNLIGLKHASRDLDAVTELLLRLGDDFRVFCGVESLSHPMLALGAAA